MNPPPQERSRESEGASSPSPAVSVVVPVYKVEKYLAECIESVLAQTFADFELILVDDGSPDRSGEICDAYATRDSRIRVFHKPNGGVTSARRLGVESARAEWICFADSDDKMFPQALAVLLEGVANDLDLVEGVVSRDPKPPVPAEPSQQNVLKIASVLNFAVEVANHNSFFWAQSPFGKIIRKSVLNATDAMGVPAWVTFGEDLLMNLRATQKIRRAKKISNVVYFYRRNAEGVCATFAPSAKYFADWLREAENTLCPGLQGEFLPAWRTVARFYFIKMFLVCPGFDPKDAYTRRIIQELWGGIQPRGKTFPWARNFVFFRSNFYRHSRCRSRKKFCLGFCAQN